MSSRIIYKNKDNTISIIIPSEEVLGFTDINTIAQKDVPYGLPYWIVPVDNILTDRTYRAAWEIDESIGEPDGYGGKSNEFDAELLKYYRSIQ